jgi:CRP/FNR family transcriptional regulator, cyclic AMP receptor protein
MEWEPLAEVPAEDLRQLLSIARRRTFARNEVVFHRGDPADSLHLIRKGYFVAHVTTTLGDTVVLAVRGPGEAFGELALLGQGGVRAATVAALAPGETLSVYRDDFHRLARRIPAINAVLVGLLAEDVRRLSRLLVEAYTVSAEKRVLRRLKELVDVYSTARSPVVIPLTQETLAGLAFTSRATVNRVLREQEQRGVVALGRGRTKIIDVDELTRRAG